MYRIKVIYRYYHPDGFVKPQRLSYVLKSGAFGNANGGNVMEFNSIPAAEKYLKNILKEPLKSSSSEDLWYDFSDVRRPEYENTGVIYYKIIRSPCHTCVV